MKSLFSTIAFFLVLISAKATPSYEYCTIDTTNDGVVYVAFNRSEARPNDPWPAGAVMKERSIDRLTEVTGVTTNAGETNYVYSIVADKYHKWAGTELALMATNERVTRDAYDVALAATNEYLYQLSKSDALKEIENRFFDLCSTLGLTGTPTFAEINTALEAMEVPQTEDAVLYSLKLLSIDAEAKREGGLSWWDTAAYHEDIE